MLLVRYKFHPMSRLAVNQHAAASEPRASNRIGSIFFCSWGTSHSVQIDRILSHGETGPQAAHYIFGLPPLFFALPFFSPANRGAFSGTQTYCIKWEENGMQSRCQTFYAYNREKRVGVAAGIAGGSESTSYETIF